MIYVVQLYPKARVQTSAEDGKWQMANGKVSELSALLPEVEAEARQRICLECPEFGVSGYEEGCGLLTSASRTGRGCLNRKRRLRAEHCPVGKW